MDDKICSKCVTLEVERDTERSRKISAHDKIMRLEVKYAAVLTDKVNLEDLASQLKTSVRALMDTSNHAAGCSWVESECSCGYDKIKATALNLLDREY